MTILASDEDLGPGYPGTLAKTAITFKNRGRGSTSAIASRVENRYLSKSVSPPPHTARPISHEYRLIPTAITAGASRVASGLLCLHAIAITPVGPVELVRSSLSIVGGLPGEKVRSAPAIIVSVGSRTGAPV